MHSVSAWKRVVIKEIESNDGGCESRCDKGTRHYSILAQRATWNSQTIPRSLGKSWYARLEYLRHLGVQIRYNVRPKRPYPESTRCFQEGRVHSL